MSTGIQWTDETWNPVVGCEKVSQGCKNCYAKQIHDTRHKAFLAGKKVAPQYAHPFETVQLKPERLLDPMRWRKPKRVFVNSVSDLFHEDVPEDFLAAVFGIMAVAHTHTFQILTKRPERMREIVSRLTLAECIAGLGIYAQQTGLDLDYDRLNHHLESYDHLWPLSNVWLGVSVEHQAAANERIPLLLDTPAAVRFLSCEPLLGPVDLTPFLYDEVEGTAMPDYSSLRASNRGLSWVIGGGESGAKARPCDIAWLRSLLADCRSAGVPFFMKQVGASVVVPFHGQSYYDGENFVDDHVLWLPHHSHGGDMAEWPEDLRIREFPEIAA